MLPPKNRNSRLLDKFSRYFPKIDSKPGKTFFKSSKDVPSYVSMYKTKGCWNPNPIRKKSIKKVDPVDDTLTTFSLDSYANEELDWA